ncbi:MAG: apolipoprotein N-acyltransferase [Bergeyella sp.]|nr:apolipoprotein N-acyltransferase [Bergeyella sp.]
MKYIFLSLISALLLSVSWPTYGVPFFVFIALVPLLLMEHEISQFSGIKKKGRVIFALSYLCFLVWNIVTTGWLYGARNPDGNHSLEAVLFPVMVNSVLYSVVFQAYYVYKKTQGTYWGMVFFVAIWMAFEKFHLSWELSWPWLNLGNVFSEYPKMIQWYDTLGATGGSFWILVVNVLVFYTYRIWQVNRKKMTLIKNSGYVLALITFPLFLSLYKYYTFRGRSAAGGEVRVLLLQPDLDPYTEKYTKDSMTILRDLLGLARGQNTKVDFYMAPETALPGSGSFLENNFDKSLLLDSIRSFLGEHAGAVFDLGISSHRMFTDKEKIPGTAYKTPDKKWVTHYNSVIQIDHQNPVEVYHKGKLVPGVELFPYMKVLKPLLGDAMLNLGGSVISLGRDKERKIFKNLHNKGVVAPVICYESIYGEFVTEYVSMGANFLGILTNDSWWGRTQGHRQLLSYARLRAIENRREVARTANSGISAHINALGEIEESTLYGDRTSLFVKIKLYEGKTFYVRSGDLLSRICLFVLGFLVVFGIFRTWRFK